MYLEIQPNYKYFSTVSLCFFFFFFFSGPQRQQNLERGREKKSRKKEKTFPLTKQKRAIKSGNLEFFPLDSFTLITLQLPQIFFFLNLWFPLQIQSH
jgi:hypothetical protein